MKSSRDKGKLLSLFLFFLILTLIFYGRIIFTWFQQDEWSVLGMYKYYLSQPWGLAKIFFYNLFAQPRFSSAPLSTTLFAFFSSIFGLNFYPYASISLLLRALNTLLVYQLVFVLTKNTKLSIITGVLFSVSGISQKPVIWILSSINVQGATFFLLLSVINFLIYLNSGKLKNLYLYIILLVIAVWFKETALSSLVIIYGYLIISKFLTGPTKEQKILFITSTVLFSMFVILRLFTAYFGKNIDFNYLPPSRLLTTKELITFTASILPLSVVDAFLVPDTLYKLARPITYIFWPNMRSFWETTKFNLLSESLGVRLVNYLLFLPFTLLLITMFISLKHKYRKGHLILKTYIIGILFVLSSVTVTLMLTIRGINGITFLARSRDLYISTVGAAIIIAIFFITNFQGFKKYLIATLFCGYTLYNFIYIQKSVINPEIVKANLRIPIINKIYNHYPTLPQKVVFFTKSDTPYYGSSNPSMPYQTGFGRTLLIWYLYNNNNIPPLFGKDDFLYLPGSEGYKEINNYGFGYFTNFDELKKTMAKNKLDKESVYAFLYSGKTNTLFDITDEIRKKI